MTPKIAALNSLAIIFSAQLVSFLTTIFQNRVPDFDLKVLLGMMLAGVTGALIGRAIAKRMDDDKTNAFFNIALWVILAINLYNVVKQFI